MGANMDLCIIAENKYLQESCLCEQTGMGEGHCFDTNSSFQVSYKNGLAKETTLPILKMNHFIE